MRYQPAIAPDNFTSYFTFMKTPLTTVPKNRKNVLLMLVCFSCVCLLAGGIRMHYSGNLKGFFLVWNLFLAWIPFIVAFVLRQNTKEISVRWLLPILAAWLLFLPNAPYIITDLVHLRPRDGVPLWFDATLIFLFAFHGLLLGIISTLFVHEVVEKHLSPFKVWAFLSGCFVLSGYGIYLGRFLRWNSWDILVHPIGLLRESLLKLTSPVAILVTGIFSLLLFFSYLIFYQLIHLNTVAHDTKNSQ